MLKEAHIVYHLEAAADTEGEIDIYTVPGGVKLKIEEISVAFPPAVDYDLEVSLYYGIVKVAPTDGVYVGKDMSFTTARDIEFPEQDKIRLHYRNTNLTTVRNAVIEIKGQLIPCK